MVVKRVARGWEVFAGNGDGFPNKISAEDTGCHSLDKVRKARTLEKGVFQSYLIQHGISINYVVGELNHAVRRRVVCDGSTMDKRSYQFTQGRPQLNP